MAVAPPHGNVSVAVRSDRRCREPVMGVRVENLFPCRVLPSLCVLFVAHRRRFPVLNAVLRSLNITCLA